MTNLKEYLEKEKGQENNSLIVTSPKVLEEVIFKEIITYPLAKISNNEAEEFSHKVAELSTSDNVINELSNKLGIPKDHETEDEFVDRAKTIFTKIVKRKLSKYDFIDRVKSILTKILKRKLSN